jgi:hypothetical protein
MLSPRQIANFRAMSPVHRNTARCIAVLLSPIVIIGSALIELYHGMSSAFKMTYYDFRGSCHDLRAFWRQTRMP